MSLEVSTIAALSDRHKLHDAGYVQHELPGRLVAKVVDRLDYVSFPFRLHDPPKALQFAKPAPIPQRILKLEDPRTDTRWHPLREGLLPECDLSYKRANVVSSAVRLRGIAAEDEVWCFIPGKQGRKLDGSKKNGNESGPRGRWLTRSIRWLG